jgi:EAL domain-containing protein (putative c-di-GMP-specific phosphodiesterase class I)
MSVTQPVSESAPVRCQGCKDGQGFAMPISMAFQPIFTIDREAVTGVFAYEALVRGKAGEGAGSVLSQVREDNRYAFDQSCRVTAIELASNLGLPATGALLSINFLPNAVYEPRACIRATLAAAERSAFPTRSLMFEVTEQESMRNPDHLLHILHSYREMGFRTAIDDFGAGYSGLGLLAKFQPDVIKVDMDLIRGIDQDAKKVVILRHIIAMCRDLGVTLVAEGVETSEEYGTLRDLGVTLFQGYYFAKPGFEQLPRLRADG